MLHRIARLVALAPVLLAGLGDPAPAAAAEGFVGVTQDGRLVRFQSDAPTGLSAPRGVTGLAPRERLVALGGAPGRVYGVGSSARLYVVDPRSGRADGIGQPFAQGLRGTRFSLAIAPRGREGRLLSDVGQSVTVDLVTGATSDAPPLRRASDGGPAFPSADFLPDGRLIGIDMARREVLTETGQGTSAFSVQPLTIERGPDFTEPSAFDIAADRRAWMLASFGGRRFRPQSVLLPLDYTAGISGLVIRPFLRRIVTFTSLGRVPDDTRAPRAQVTIPRRISLRDLRAGRLRVGAVSNEGGQASAYVRIPGRRSTASALSTRDVPGAHTFRYFWLSPQQRPLFRARVGRTVRVTVRVRDWANNFGDTSRLVRLTR